MYKLPLGVMCGSISEFFNELNVKATSHTLPAAAAIELFRSRAIRCRGKLLTQTITVYNTLQYIAARPEVHAYASSQACIYTRASKAAAVATALLQFHINNRSSTA